MSFLRTSLITARIGATAISAIQPGTVYSYGDQTANNVAGILTLATTVTGPAASYITILEGKLVQSSSLPAGDTAGVVDGVVAVTFRKVVNRWDCETIAQVNAATAYIKATADKSQDWEIVMRDGAIVPTSDYGTFRQVQMSGSVTNKNTTATAATVDVDHVHVMTGGSLVFRPDTHLGVTFLETFFLRLVDCNGVIVEGFKWTYAADDSEQHSFNRTDIDPSPDFSRGPSMNAGNAALRFQTEDATVLYGDNIARKNLFTHPDGKPFGLWLTGIFARSVSGVFIEDNVFDGTWFCHSALDIDHYASYRNVYKNYCEDVMRCFFHQNVDGATEDIRVEMINCTVLPPLDEIDLRSVHCDVFQVGTDQDARDIDLLLTHCYNFTQVNTNDILVGAAIKMRSVHTTLFGNYGTSLARTRGQVANNFVITNQPWGAATTSRGENVIIENNTIIHDCISADRNGPNNNPWINVQDSAADGHIVRNNIVSLIAGDLTKATLSNNTEYDRDTLGGGVSLDTIFEGAFALHGGDNCGVRLVDEIDLTSAETARYCADKLFKPRAAFATQGHLVPTV